MGKNYFLHRISHEWEVSYPLLDAGYLSIGWSDYHNEDIMRISRDDNLEAFKHFMEMRKNTSRARWGLWYFSQFKPGDFIVVPLFGKEFAVCEILDYPENVHLLNGRSISLGNGRTARVGEKGIVEGDKHYDIGFVVHIKVLKRIPREYATNDLISRMKLRQTSARIDDLKGDVENAINATGPVDIHKEILAAVNDAMKKTIETYITPDNLESAVKWYMEKKGADKVWIPGKNEPGKENGADADVIAEFYDLGIVFYIQVKNHKYSTGDWAVTQIKEYLIQKQNDRDDITYIPWVISTADDFTSEAKELAAENGVRLINGDSFIRMILNMGLDGIEAVKKG